MRGSKHGKDAEDVIWIGQIDAEGTFIWQGKSIQDLYVRYLDEGLLTLHVRCTVDVKLKDLIDWVSDYLATKLKMGDALEALRAGQLHVNYEGGPVSGENLVSAFPSKSMFLLSRGQLAEKYTAVGCNINIWLTKNIRNK